MAFCKELFFLSTFIFVSPLPMQINHQCKTPRNGVCINIWKCPKYVILLRNAPSPKPLSLIMDIRRNLCGFVDENTPEVCCENTILPTTAQPPPSFIYKGDLMKHKNFKLLPRNCGRISTGYRIIGGTDTFPGEYPWMALIAYSVWDLPEFRCGGTLISERYVLTAAHCIDNDSILGVRLGEYDLLTEKDCDDEKSADCEQPVQDYLIDKIVTHPLYDPKTHINDIALIKIANSANLSVSNVSPICLPFGNAANYDLSGKKAIVAGWGITENGDKSTVLRKTSIPVIPLKDCQKLQIYRDAQLLKDNQICAGGYKRRDSCNGDSGGPLKLPINIDSETRFVQYGIVSYGPRSCGADGIPAIYTKVAAYLGWILDNLEP